MDVLILGGPKFLGIANIDAALAAGHNVTVFNRGRTNPDLYPQIEKLHGDRNGDLAALHGRNWDFVIDSSGFVPRIVRQSAEMLKDAVGRYVFISSVSVYKDFENAGFAEDAPVGTLEDETVEEVDGNTYGPLKALCERAVQYTYGERTIVVRPGLIVGPHDDTYRFTYWLTRAARGGEMLAPTGPDYAMQVIDVRDLAEWTVRLAGSGATGTYNVTGPDYDLTIGAVLDAARKISGSDTEITWASEEFLLKNRVIPWVQMPLWVPASMKIHSANIDRAIAAGLTFRPLDVTVRDTLEWAQANPAPDPPPAGLTAERESELLAAWRASSA